MKFTIEKGRLAFAQGVFKPTKGEGDGEAAYNCKFILPAGHKDIKRLEEACLKVAVDKWGPVNGPKIFKALKADDKLAIHDGDRKPQWEGFEGNMYVNVRNAKKPSVRDRNRNDIDQDSGLIYSGAWVYGYIELWAQDNKHGKRINASFRGVQHFDHGDAFAGGGATAADEEEMVDLSVNDEIE